VGHFDIRMQFDFLAASNETIHQHKHPSPPSFSAQCAWQGYVLIVKKDIAKACHVWQAFFVLTKL